MTQSKAHGLEPLASMPPAILDASIKDIGHVSPRESTGCSKDLDQSSWGPEGLYTEWGLDCAWVAKGLFAFCDPTRSVLELENNSPCFERQRCREKTGEKEEQREEQDLGVRGVIELEARDMKPRTDRSRGHLAWKLGQVSSSWNRKWGHRWSCAASLHRKTQLKVETSGSWTGWAVRMAWSRSPFALWLFKLGSW